MSINNFSTELFALTINGRPISDWGETATPFSSEQIDDSTTVRRGQGGNACSLDRINPGEAVSIYLNPGSPDSGYVKALQISKAVITMSLVQIGTLEAAIGTEGRIVRKAARGRAGTSITDDQYNFEFNIWNETMGGE